jgi:hypothetical protein
MLLGAANFPVHQTTSAEMEKVDADSPSRWP